jgi:agmatinase
MKTTVLVFPFDLFGNGGAAAGAQLLADALREMLADNASEKVATRARAYEKAVQLKEFTFDKLADYEGWRAKARQAIRQVWRKDEFLLWITGNHLGTLPVYDELAQDRDGLLVVQFDAHLDVYNLSDCTSELSHGNFLRHCDGPLPGIINLGHRDLFLRPAYVERYYQQTFSAAQLAIDPAPALAYLGQACKPAQRIFLDFDCDVFDPAYFPALGHALPFGLNPPLVLRLLEAVFSQRVVGLALSEFEPSRDVNDRSLATLVWLMEYLLLIRHERHKSASNPTMTS